MKGLGTLVVLFALALHAAPVPHTRMLDGRHWMTRNFPVNTAGSFCYGDSESNCAAYGRLYTWDSALQACTSLDGGWHLPSDAEWDRLAQQYGGKSAYEPLLRAGKSGFNVLLGGGRGLDGTYARLEAHGFYWTSTEDGPGTAIYYNFAKGQKSLFRQSEGEKGRAFSVRCVRE